MMARANVAQREFFNFNTVADLPFFDLIFWLE